MAKDRNVTPEAAAIPEAAGVRKKRNSPQSDKVNRFVHEYLRDLNATKAAVRAGYSSRSAYVKGSRLLAEPKVLGAIQRAEAQTAARLEITRDEWLAELKLIAFSDVSNFMEMDDDGTVRVRSFDRMPGGSSRSIESAVSTQVFNKGRVVGKRIVFKTHPKIEALKLIGKHLGFLADRAEYPEQDGLQLSLRILFDKSGVPSLPEFIKRMASLASGGNDVGNDRPGRTIDVQPVGGDSGSGQEGGPADPAVEAPKDQ
jgi:phage terminase small subunit